MIRTDLLIVGASFAGLACARRASQAGLDVLVLEKKANAGDKLHTTGILVKEAVEQAPWLQDVPRHLIRPIEGVRLYAPNMKAINLRAPGYYYWATETPGLLNWMTSETREQGAQILTSTLFETAERIDGGGWRIGAARGSSGVREALRIEARYLIGADGPTSRVARALGLSRNTEFIYGMEREYTDVELDADFMHCFIDRRLAAGYIGWALTTQGYSQIGLARRLPSQKNGWQQAGALPFDAFLEKISSVVKVRCDAMAVRAGMIPCGGTLKRIACPGAMLVGDAAGTVSPVTAGGIRAALEYGDKAGAAAAAFLQGRADDPEKWLVKKYPTYGRKRLLRRCFDRWQSDWLFNRLLGMSAFQRFAQQVYFHRKGESVSVS